MKFGKRRKDTKTDFLSAKVISVNDMLWHTFMRLKYTNYAFEENLSNYSINDMREYVTHKINEELCIDAGNIIILFTFSDNYLADCSEFLSATSFLVTNFKVDNSNTGRLKILKHKDKDGVTKSIGRDNVNINYLLVSGPAREFINLFMNINSLSNPLLLELTNIIYDNIDHSLFKELIDDGILQLDKFKSFDSDLFIPRNSSVHNDDLDTNYYIVDFDNVDNILLQLPSVFSSVDLVNMFSITFSDRNDRHIFIEYTLYDLIYNLYNGCADSTKWFIELANGSKIYYDNIIKSAYRIRDMEDAIKPVYNRVGEDEDNFITGKSDDIDEEYINEIKGANIYSPLLENQTELVDIDEELSEDDPEYNQVDEELKNK